MIKRMSYEEIELRIILADCLKASLGEGPQEIRDPDPRIKGIVNGLLREGSIHASVLPDVIVLHSFTPKGQKVYCVGGDLDTCYALQNLNQIKEK